MYLYGYFKYCYQVGIDEHGFTCSLFGTHPSFLGSLSCDLNSLSLGETFSSSFPAFLSQRHGSRIFSTFIWHVLRVVGFTYAQVYDEFAELVGVAGAFGLLHTAKHGTVAIDFQLQFRRGLDQTNALPGSRKH